MLINLSRILRRITKPILCFWFFSASMVFCAFSSASPLSLLSPSGGSYYLASVDQSGIGGHHISAPSAESDDFVALHSEHSAFSPVTKFSHSHHHAMTDGNSLHGFHGVADHGNHEHGSDCCGEASATSNFAFFVDLPTPAFMLILLAFGFRNQSLRRYIDHLKPPPWSSPPIPLLNCSFLK